MMEERIHQKTERIIKLKKFRTPQTYAEAFDILGERGILPAEFAFSFATIAGFRNFLAHDYEKIDGTVICTEVMKRLEDVEQYLQYIEEKAAQHCDADRKTKDEAS